MNNVLVIYVKESMGAKSISNCVHHILITLFNIQCVNSSVINPQLLNVGISLFTQLSI